MITLDQWMMQFHFFDRVGAPFHRQPRKAVMLLLPLFPRAVLFTIFITSFVGQLSCEALSAQEKNHKGSGGRSIHNLIYWFIGFRLPLATSSRSFHSYTLRLCGRSVIYKKKIIKREKKMKMHRKLDITVKQQSMNTSILGFMSLFLTHPSALLDRPTPTKRYFTYISFC
jgi:hypothetical protein